MKPYWLCVATLLTIASPVEATPITYSISAVATGITRVSTNDSIPFTNERLTISATGDTTGIYVAPDRTLYTNATDNGFISITGVGSGTTASLQFFDHEPASIIGVLPVSGFDLLYNSAPAFQTYTLDTSVGPVAGTAIVISTQFTSLPTSLGYVAVFSVEPQSGLFTTVVAPEPSTLPILTILFVSTFLSAFRPVKNDRYCRSLSTSTFALNLAQEESSDCSNGTQITSWGTAELFLRCKARLFPLSNVAYQGSGRPLC